MLNSLLQYLVSLTEALANPCFDVFDSRFHVLQHVGSDDLSVLCHRSPDDW